ncbi:hypothetical protein A3860_38980 [Niastella vici]|uniref:Uncharacterized protein n=1 Tax=Niastella vici TaxID=1703345 RepID=A0A1V9FL38_9BACT|nr:hypothetical protein A3860_38980 [Niastella vici]
MQAGKGGGKDRVRKGIMELGNEILSPIDGLIASYLGGKLVVWLYLGHISGKIDKLSSCKAKTRVENRTCGVFTPFFSEKRIFRGDSCILRGNS